MRGINKVILVGHLGGDPEVRYMPGGGAVANITVATSESWTDKQSNEKKEQTEWHRVVIYQRLAEIVGEYARKGAQVYIEGRLRTRKWQDQQGVERYTTEIVASEFQLLGSQQKQQEPDGAAQNAPARNAPRNAPPAQAPAPAYNAPAAPANNSPQQGGNGALPGPQPTDFDDDIPFCAHLDV